MQAVVYSENGRSIGLLVGRIQDVVKQHIEVQHTGEGSLLLGSAVIQERVTDLLDIRAAIRAADSTFFSEESR
jgi:two-component system chemotaxis sensor kinase CheA